MVAVVPILKRDLRSIADFLAQGFGANGSAEAWLRAFRQTWAEHPPNHGFMLKDGERIVGAIGAIYSDQTVHGRRERFCNINNWYVDPGYRQHSIMLLSRLLAQPATHFTNLTPRPDLIGIFQALKFRYLGDGRVRYLFNTPTLVSRRSRVLTGKAAMAALPADDAKVFADHGACDGLGQVALGSPQSGFAHVAFYRMPVRRISCVTVLHVSSPSVFQRHLPALRSHFLARHGALLTRVEARWLPEKVPLSVELQRRPYAMYLSRTLNPDDVTCLYTELAALHARRAA
jgi:hypothetical protein